MDPILHLVERSSGIIDPTSGSLDLSAWDIRGKFVFIKLINLLSNMFKTTQC